MNKKKGEIILRKNSKKKAVVRVIAAILIIVLAGVASYYGSKAIFTNKFRKDKVKAEKEEQEKIKKSVQSNYVTVIRVGKLVSLRIFDTENSKLAFILMRPDSDLFTYDEDGNAEEIKKVVNNIQNAYGITVDSYEDFDQSAFAELINDSESFECDLPNAVTFKDNNKMTVNIEAGKQTLNGTQAWGVISGEGDYESQEDLIANAKAFLESYMNEIFKDVSESSISDYASTLFSLCDSDKKASDLQYYMSYYAKLTPEDITVTEFEGKEKDDTFEVDITKAKALISDITEGTTESTTTEEKTTAEEVSSEGKTIYIRNAANINGIATEWKQELQDDGYTIGSVDNYDEIYDKTVIAVSEEGMGEDLKSKYFKDAEIKVGDVEDGADICIYLGKDADTLD